VTGYRCIAPTDDAAQQLCGARATTTRIVDDLVCHLCSAHAAELDHEQSEDSMTIDHLIIGLRQLSGTRTERGIRYYAHEIGAYVIVSEDDVARLGAMLDAREPDAYSLWCAETAYEVAS
jgi:hypothetical protein